jgi:hypothetical protein
VARSLQAQAREQTQEGDKQPGVPCHQIVSQTTKRAKEHDESFGMVGKSKPVPLPFGRSVMNSWVRSVAMPAL